MVVYYVRAQHDQVLVEHVRDHPVIWKKPYVANAANDSWRQIQAVMEIDGNNFFI